MPLRDFSEAAFICRRTLFLHRFIFYMTALLFHLCALRIQRTAILVRRKRSPAIRLPYFLSTISALLR